MDVHYLANRLMDERLESVQPVLLVEIFVRDQNWVHERIYQSFEDVAIAKTPALGLRTIFVFFFILNPNFLAKAFEGAHIIQVSSKHHFVEFFFLIHISKVVMDFFDHLIEPFVFFSLYSKFVE